MRRRCRACAAAVVGRHRGQGRVSLVRRRSPLARRAVGRPAIGTRRRGGRTRWLDGLTALASVGCPGRPRGRGTWRKRGRSRRRNPRAPRSRRRFTRPAPLVPVRVVVPVPPFVHLRPRVPQDPRVPRIPRVSLEISRVPRVRPRLPPPPVPAPRELPIRGSVRRRRRRRPIPVAIVFVVVVPAVGGSVPAVVAVVLAGLGWRRQQAQQGQRHGAEMELSVALAADESEL